MIPLNSALNFSDSQTRDMHRIYKYLHQTPELSMQEHKTSQFVRETLVSMGFETFICGGTGVVGILQNGEGPVLGYRADMDGLPIHEATGLSYASTATGLLPDGSRVPVMHGCGHDMHMTVALTVARVLSEHRKVWSGTALFIFQPGEETAQGARAMIDDGLWEKAPKPSVIYGQHVWPGLAGSVMVTKGVAMAMADSWKVTVKGKQAHGSQPDQSIDPIVLGAHMIVRIQTIVAREVSPLRAAVITVGTFHGGLKENIIPGEAEFTLNVRTFDPEVRELVLTSLRRTINAEAEASGAPIPSIESLSSFPICYNNPSSTEEVIDILGKTLGDQSVHEMTPVMGSEDFGLLADAIGAPSVFWFFGGNSPAQLNLETPPPSNHSPHFAPVIEPTLITGLRAATNVLLSKFKSAI